jgi:phosphate starvation-inducible membrane PsiE
MVNSGYYREALEFTENHLRFQESGDMPVAYPVHVASAVIGIRLGRNIVEDEEEHDILLMDICCCCLIVVIIYILEKSNSGRNQQ